MPMKRKRERVATCMVLETASLTDQDNNAGNDIRGEMPQAFMSFLFFLKLSVVRSLFLDNLFELVSQQWNHHSQIA